MSSSEKEWKEKLTCILEELTPPQYKKTLFFLDKIPQSFRTCKAKENMVQKIIETYGVEESILEMREVMKKIPRMDHKIQDLLQPCKHFRHKQQKKKKDQQQSSQSEKRKTIRNLKSSGQLLNTEIIVGKVVKKSDLRTYTTQENVKKSFFNLAVADRTASIKMMVYGEERFADIREDRCYSFKNVIMDGSMIKVTKMSRVQKHRSIKVSPDLETEAKKLISQASGGVGGSAAGAQDAAVHPVTIKITGIIKSNKTYIHLQAEVNQHQQKVMVTNRLLAKAFGFTPGEDFKEKLCGEMPLSAEVKIQGNKITYIKKM